MTFKTTLTAAVLASWSSPLGQHPQCWLKRSQTERHLCKKRESWTSFVVAALAVDEVPQHPMLHSFRRLKMKLPNKPLSKRQMLQLCKPSRMPKELT